MGNWLREKWPELVILVFILGLAGLGVNLRDRIIKQEARTDGIVAALPDLRTRVAYEYVFNQFPAAVLISQPYSRDGKWGSDIKLLDASRGDVIEFQALRSGKSDPNGLWALVGKLKHEDPRAASFSAVQKMGFTAHVTSPVPRIVDKDSSLIVYRDADEVRRDIESLGFAYVGEHTIQSIDNWGELLSVVEEGEISLGPEKVIQKRNDDGAKE